MSRNIITVPLAAGFGLAFGWLLSERRRSHKLKEKTAESSPAMGSISPKQFQKFCAVLYDAHKHILAVSKALQKPTP